MGWVTADYEVGLWWPVEGFVEDGVGGFPVFNSKIIIII
jgi:hypothetical protein